MMKHVRNLFLRTSLLSKQVALQFQSLLHLGSEVFRHIGIHILHLAAVTSYEESVD